MSSLEKRLAVFCKLPLRAQLAMITSSKSNSTLSRNWEYIASLEQLHQKSLNAAIAWSRWEAACSSMDYSPSRVEDFSNPEFALAFALIENHYFMNHGFLETEDQLLKGVEAIRGIPATIVQGRYDMVCPAQTAYELAAVWPEASLVIAPFSGHTAFEPEIIHELIKATDNFGTTHS